MVGSAPHRIKPEVIFDLIPQVLAQVGPAVAASQSYQERAEEAVVLIRREVARLVIDADRVPAVEQVAQLLLQISQIVLVAHDEHCPEAGRATARARIL